MIWLSFETVFQCGFNHDGDYVIWRLHCHNIPGSGNQIARSQNRIGFFPRLSCPRPGYGPSVLLVMQTNLFRMWTVCKVEVCSFTCARHLSSSLLRTV